MQLPIKVFAKLAILAMALVMGSNVQASPEVTISQAIAMHGEPKYKEGFTHFEYVNPDAPKGGTVRRDAVGTFDTLNNFTPKGNSAQGLGLIYDTLLTRSLDEPFTLYGLIAEKIELPKDRSWIKFHLNPNAKFHDGKAISANDVVFTFNTLIKKGPPHYQAYYEDVESVTAIDSKTVKFVFKPTNNAELPLIVGELPVLPEHYWKNKDFSKSTLTAPLGSGPYKIEQIEPGRSISYQRVDNYWAKNHPINKGTYNYDTVIYDYYRDRSIALEAFKAHELDYREENNSKLWATAYDIPQVKSGDIVKELIPHQRPVGMQGFAMNTRREIFKDPKVREALALAFDFEWTNKNLFYGQYKRTKSYFDNTELASTGLPSEEELEILLPYKDQLPEEVFTKEYQPPYTDGNGKIRNQLRLAWRKLKAAGWTIKGGKLLNKNNEQMTFEIMLYAPAFERVVNPFRKNLERLGIDVSIRMVDVTQYINRLRSFDYDMIIATFGQSSSPGNEQRNYWGSKYADQPSSRNFIGIKNPVIDEIIEKLIAADSRESLVNLTRALDRVLLWNHYVIPQHHISAWRVAYWDTFERPKISPKLDIGFFTWWIKPGSQTISVKLQSE